MATRRLSLQWCSHKAPAVSWRTQDTETTSGGLKPTRGCRDRRQVTSFPKNSENLRRSVNPVNWFIMWSPRREEVERG